MSLFKKIFSRRTKEEGKSAEQPVDDQPIDEAPVNSVPEEIKEIINKKSQHETSSGKLEENFATELYESLHRYYSIPDLQISLNLTDKDGSVLKPHEAFNAVFDQWCKIKSKWDRTGLFFGFWDQSEFKKLTKWQIIERYNNDRSPLKGLEFQRKHITESDFNEVNLLVALAKMNRLLSSYAKARQIIEFAHNNVPDDAKIKVEYANILHLAGDEKDKELAHQLINGILEEKIRKANTQTIALLNYFSFSTDYIDSSIFAAIFLSDGDANLDDWDIMANEYYYCPVFRYEHAVKLNQSGDALRSLAKLNSLAEEFPWYEQGVVTTVDVISQFRLQMKNPSFMEEEMEKLKHYLTVIESRKKA